MALPLAVPMYVHPLVDPAGWARLVDLADHLAFVVANVHSGPGRGPDADYARVLAPLLDRGVPVVGYVDAAYGRRPLAEVAADAAAWRRDHGVPGVFVDCAPSLDRGWAHRAAQALGGVQGRRVVNPGTWACADLAVVADTVVTFEGSWTTYRRGVTGRPVGLAPQIRPVTGVDVCHLIYDVPADDTDHAAALAGARGATSVLTTDGVLPNPYLGLPARIPGGRAATPAWA